MTALKTSVALRLIVDPEHQVRVQELRSLHLPQLYQFISALKGDFLNQILRVGHGNVIEGVDLVVIEANVLGSQVVDFKDGEVLAFLKLEQILDALECGGKSLKSNNFVSRVLPPALFFYFLG